ncbi:uncharacterized protein si:ch211-210c8.6 isoform X2 [Colossoma macropomum]|uniref:uncharacterized protein si:ch211-210c8.6 isoform X2 n=1 Tax=Colossoma macropomum TaxID=42526 RepID=UPI00186504CD|nr:uncharacterized protein si:ch211-210c8.6 isoform X2 [Colossoma macropomum]
MVDDMKAMGVTLAKCAAVDLGVQWVGWALASAMKTEKFFDLAGSGTFVLLAHLSRIWGGTRHLRQNVQTGLVTAWGLRSKDATSFRKLSSVFVPAVWVFVALMPTLILNTEQKDKPLGPRDYAGWLIWGLGFATEAIADQQKWNFKNDPDNAGKFIQHGLWAYSRHPNYLGEILQWSGVFLSASSVMRGPQHLSVVSPLFVWFLLRHASGIPILEKQAMKKWGADPAFQNYIKNTPLLWPFPLF